MSYNAYPVPKSNSGNINGQFTNVVRPASAPPDAPMIVSSNMLSGADKDRSSLPKAPCNGASSNTSSATDAQQTPPTGSSCESIHGSSSPPADSNGQDKNHQEVTGKDDIQEIIRADRTKEAPSGNNAQGLFFANACVFVGK